MKRRTRLAQRIIACLMTVLLVAIPFQAPVFADEAQPSVTSTQEASDASTADGGASEASSSSSEQEQEAKQSESKAAEEPAEIENSEVPTTDGQVPEETPAPDDAATDGTMTEGELADSVDSEASQEAPGDESATQPGEEVSDGANSAGSSAAQENFPAFSRQQATVDGVTVKVSAPANTFPESATLYIDGATKAQRKRVNAAVDAQRDDDRNVACFYVFDIKVLDADGNELQPANGSDVSISFTLDEVADENLDTQVYHVAQKGTSLEAEQLKVKESGDVATVKTSGFSFYTVEFTYGSLEYVMNGGSTIPLSTILNAVGLVGTVTDVAVSDESLFSAAKSGGAWTVTAHRAFTSTEWMRVTIDGVTYQITVTDDIASGDYHVLPWRITDEGVLQIGREHGLCTINDYDIGASGENWPWRADSLRSQIKKVEFLGTVDTASDCRLTGMFATLNACTTIDLTNLDTSNVTDMSEMFYGCGVQSITYGTGWNTANVTDMSHMFDNAGGIAAVNMTGWNTSKVTDMSFMFTNCGSLKSVNFGGCDTSKVEDMSFMFMGDQVLETITWGTGWNTSNVTNMNCMFDRCFALTSFSISFWNTSKVEHMSDMFCECTGLTSLDLNGWDTSNVCDMNNAFAGCSNLTFLDIYSFSTAGINLGNIHGMFDDLDALESFRVGPAFDLGMFYQATMFLDERLWCLETDMSTSYTFTELANACLENTYDVTTKNGTYVQVYAVTLQPGTGWGEDAVITVKTTDGYCTLPADCPTELNPPSADKALYRYVDVTDSSKTYCKGEDVTPLDSSVTLRAVWEIGGTYDSVDWFIVGDGSLEIGNPAFPNSFDTQASRTAADYPWLAYASDIRSVEFVNTIGGSGNHAYMFSGCSNLETIDLSDFSAGNVTSIAHMFEGCSKLTSVTGLFLTDTANTTDLNSLFKGCSALVSVDLAGWTTTNVTDMGDMFNGCSSLTTLDISSLNMASVTNAAGMLSGLTSLAELKLGAGNNISGTDFDNSFIWNPEGDYTTRRTAAQLMADYVPAMAGTFVANFMVTFDPGTGGSGSAAPVYVSAATPEYTIPNVPTGISGPGSGEILHHWESGGTTYTVGHTTTLTADLALTAVWQVGSGTFRGVDWLITSDDSRQLQIGNQDGVTEQVYDWVDTDTDLLPASWPWYSYAGSIKSVKFVAPVKGSGNHECMLYGSSMVSADVAKFDTTNVTNMENIFSTNWAIQSLDLSSWDIGNVENTSLMFCDCIDLESVDLTGWNFSKVTDMGAMFSGCTSLTNAGLSTVPWSSALVVDDIGNLFENCTSLTSLDLTSLDTSNVTSTQDMFLNCSNLESVNTSNWDTQNVIYMFGMFEGCSSLTKLDISSFDMGNVTYALDMLAGLDALKELALGPKCNLADTNLTTTSDYWSTDGQTAYSPSELITYFNADPTNRAGTYYAHFSITLKHGTYSGSDVVMFVPATGYTAPSFVPAGWTAPDGYILYQWKLGSTGDTKYDMLSSLPITTDGDTLTPVNCYGGVYDGVEWRVANSREDLLLGNPGAAQAYTNSDTRDWPWYSDGHLYHKDIKKANFWGAVEGNGSLESMFDRCENLTDIVNLANLNTSNVTDMSYMFAHCDSLVSMSLTGWDTSNVTNMAGMFQLCDNLTSVNLSGLDVSNVTDIGNMFDLDVSLVSVDFTGWNPSKVTSVQDLFSECYSLTTVDISNWNMPNLTNMYGTFWNCTSLTSLDLSHWNTSNVTNMTLTFGGCTNLSTLNVSGWDTSNVSDMGSMFYNCSSLTSLDLSNWHTEKVDDMDSLFEGCTNLASLKLDNWSNDVVTTMRSMFENCTSLTSLDLSTFKSPQVNVMSSMFAGCTGLTTLDLSGLSTEETWAMDYMFDGCTSLATLDLSSFNTGKVGDASAAFAGCTNLKKLDISSFHLEDASVNDMLTGLDSLQELSIGASAFVGTSTFADTAFDTTAASPTVIWSADMETPYTRAELINTYDSAANKATFAGTYHASFTVTFKAGEGSGADVIVYVPQMAAYTLPGMPTGFTAPPLKEFNGWDLGGMGESVIIGADTTAIAQWKYLPFTITFYDEDGSTVLDTQTLTYGTFPVYGGPIPVKAPDEQYSYGFSTWMPAIASVIGNADYTAQYSGTAHVWSAPTWTWGADNSSATAKFTCANCGHVVSKSASVTSTVMPNPTCIAAGTEVFTASLTFAGNNYSDTTTASVDPLGHSYPVWSNDAVNHWKTCSRCGDVKNFGAHVSSGPATENEAEVCTLCGYVITPPLGHQHMNHLTRVKAKDPACTKRGNIAHYKCSCGKLFADKNAFEEIVDRGSVKTAALGHDFSDSWTSNSSKHWHVCKRCGKASSKKSHLSSGAATVEHAEVCTVCGHTINPVLIVISSAAFADTGETTYESLMYQKTKDDEDDWTVTLQEAKPVKNGYYFEYWKCSQTGEKHQPGDSLTFTYKDAQEVTFTAVWTQLISEGTYNLAKGTRYRFGEGIYTMPGDSTVYSGEQYVCPPTDDTFTFVKGRAS